MTNRSYRDIFDRLKARERELAASSAAERIAKIERLYQAVYELRAEIGAAGMAEIGLDGRAQVLPLKDYVADIRENLAGWMTLKDQPQSPALAGRRAYVHHEPKGVVLHLSTWNAPVLISLSPVMSMIAAGNAVVLKPSEIAPHAADAVARVVEKAGLGDDIAVVTGGPDVARQLLKLPFNHICYVGNNRVGKLVMQAAAEHFAGVTLEMGGKNPIIVAADAHLDDAAGKIVHGRMILGGQGCLCPDYVLADAAIKDALAEKIAGRIRAFYDPEGRGFAESSDVARIINERHVARIKALVEDAVDKGSKVVIGAEIDPSQRFISPTLLDGIDESMDIFQEEVFGPVLTIEAFATPEAAISEIEKRPKPLGLYVFTASPETADWYLRHTRAGSSTINNIALQALVPSLPFGGVNHSGMGRLNGEAGFQEFSNARGVVEDAFDPARGNPMAYPPFPKEMVQSIDMMMAPTN